MVNAWKETSLATLLSNYELKDIYNADEFGLFYKCVINKTYQLKSEKCSGGKLSKIRITGMAAANPVGDKIPVFVIGKSSALVIGNCPAHPHIENLKSIKLFFYHRIQISNTAYGSRRYQITKN